MAKAASRVTKAPRLLAGEHSACHAGTVDALQQASVRKFTEDKGVAKYLHDTQPQPQDHTPSNQLAERKARDDDNGATHVDDIANHHGPDATDLVSQFQAGQRPQEAADKVNGYGSAWRSISKSGLSFILGAALTLGYGQPQLRQRHCCAQCQSEERSLPRNPNPTVLPERHCCTAESMSATPPPGTRADHAYPSQEVSRQHDSSDGEPCQFLAAGAQVLVLHCEEVKLSGLSSFQLRDTTS